MRTIILHIIAYSLIYAVFVALLLGVVGVVNRLFHKPFFDDWCGRLFWSTFTLLVGWLIDLVPGKLQVIIGVPAGLILLAVVIWVFVKYPRLPSKRKSPDTTTKQGSA
jgi:hypothetical protein